MNYWNLPNIPHKGWVLCGFEDVEKDLESCEMCGNENIRYVHIVENAKCNLVFRVGCVCAEKMTNDYITPKQLEKKAKSKISKKQRFLKKVWNKTENNNLTLKFQGVWILIFKYKNKYKCKIGEVWGNKIFDTVKETKLAIFEGIEYFKEKGVWEDMQY